MAGSLLLGSPGRGDGHVHGHSYLSVQQLARHVCSHDECFAATPAVAYSHAQQDPNHYSDANKNAGAARLIHAHTHGYCDRDETGYEHLSAHGHQHSASDQDTNGNPSYPHDHAHLETSRLIG